MPELRDPSRPPSDPRPLGRGPMARAAQDRSARVQLGAALVLGLILLATGLYLWRRPHTVSDAEPSDADTASAMALSDAAPPPPAPVEPPSPVTLSDARVLGCHDRGPRKTPADQCDHVVTVEKALTTAVQDAASCMTTSESGGTIEYVADVSFSRHKLSVTLPRAGRSVRDRKVLSACASAVRSSMHRVTLDGVDHEHARYQISVTATYRATAHGG